MARQTAITHPLESNTLADLLERVLDKGIVIAGDIKIKLVDVELLTLQIRLLICSVDKAREIGVDWWANNPAFQGPAQQAQSSPYLSDTEERLARMETALDKMVPPG
jgi:hypothetical protein